jgi:hypothetical protein
MINHRLLVQSKWCKTEMKWSRDHVLTCSYMRDLDCGSLQIKCYYWQTKIVISSSNVVRGRSQLSKFSLAYSFSWTLPHPESVQEDDPAISPGLGLIALFVFSVLAPWWPSQESDWTEIWPGRSLRSGMPWSPANSQIPAGHLMVAGLSPPEHPPRGKGGGISCYL